VRGAWHGRLAAEWNLAGPVSTLEFARHAEGQHPQTGAELVRHRQAFMGVTASGERIRTMEHRAASDATLSAPKSVSLTALVGGDERVRDAHRAAVGVALGELSR
jgi:conjugative relaxase-like TrwC/TraI family protein